MNTVVFLGPSLPKSEAAALLPEATFLPPARQADVVSALADLRPTAVALIDGEFHQARSVWHKELLYVLEQGVPLYGCSSMGALRAAELAAFGMRGRGQVFARFAAGELVDDDEVALAYHQDDGRYRAVSEPMVNIRATVAAAADADVISIATADAVIRIAKSLEYPQRHQAALTRRMKADSIAESEVAAFALFWRDHRVDVKADDARALLRELREGTDATPRFHSMVRTESIEALVERERRVRVRGREVVLAEIAEHVHLHHPDSAALAEASLNRGLALVLADLFDVAPSAAEVQHEAVQWRRRHQLTGDDDFAGWLQSSHVSAEEFDSLAAAAARCRALHRWLLDIRGARGSTALLLDLLRWTGAFEEWADSAAVSSELADLAEARAPDEIQRLRELGTSALAAQHERDIGVPVSADALSTSGFLSTDELDHALTRAAAARIELLRQLREADRSDAG